MSLRVVPDECVSFGIVDDYCILSSEGCGGVGDLSHGVGWEAHALLDEVGVGYSL